MFDQKQARKQLGPDRYLPRAACPPGLPERSAIALFSALAHLLMIDMLLMLPETRGRAIASLESEAPGSGAQLAGPP